MSVLVGVYECTDDASEPFVHNHISTELPKEGDFVPVATTAIQRKHWKNKIWRIGIAVLTDDCRIVNTKWLNES